MQLQLPALSLPTAALCQMAGVVCTKTGWSHLHKDWPCLPLCQRLLSAAAAARYASRSPTSCSLEAITAACTNSSCKSALLSNC